MRLGSWRDREVARDVKLLAAVGVVVVLALAAGDLAFMVLGPLALGGLAAVLMLGRRRRSASHEGALGQAHPGPNMSRIPIAGFPGLVFAVGMVWMFWFGIPGFRPIVLGVIVVGSLAGLLLIAIEKRHRPPTSNLLGLTNGRSPHNKGDGPEA